MTDIFSNKQDEQVVIYLATNGRRCWGICPAIQIGGFFLYECAPNWSVIRREHFDTIQEAMDTAQLTENAPLVWNKAQSHDFSRGENL